MFFNLETVPTRGIEVAGQSLTLFTCEGPRGEPS